MIEEYFSFNKINKAVAVGINLPDEKIDDTLSSIKELKFLAKTLSIDIVESFVQKRNKIESNYFIGTGKLNEINEYVKNNKLDAVIFNNELSGIQARNLEKLFKKSVFGRTELILNIFSKRAKTNEAKLQVQLASLEYMMPRLRHRWDHFSRVEGGIGMRGGEGEKQIELDKRMLQRQILKVKNKLKKVDKQMKNRRKSRQGKNIVSLVGYTNAGKTTLFNLLSKEKKFTENMLFATLDSTIRKVYINDQLTILLSDTVGFINKLPHSLVVSFKSTLDEILNSKLILHVIDCSSNDIIRNINSVNKVLDEIGANDIPKLRIFNKKDLLENDIIDCIIPDDSNNIYISALKNEGIDDLKEKIFSYISTNVMNYN